MCESQYWKKQIEELQSSYADIEVIISDKEKLTRDLKDADAVVTYRMNSGNLSYADNLKIVFVPYTGINNFPVEALKNKGIALSNSHANTKYVAEFAIALTLSVMCRLRKFDTDLRKGEWNRKGIYSMYWDSIQGKTAGFLGTGSMALHIAELLKSFKCNVIGYNRKGFKPDIFDSLLASPEQLISKSDIVYNCLPLTKYTENMIDAELLSRMEGKFLISMGRGKTINEEALYNALKSGQIKGAGIDVWYDYPAERNPVTMPSSLPFHELDNIIMTPHCSSHTIPAEKADIDETMYNIKKYIEKGEIHNEIDLDAYY